MKLTVQPDLDLDAIQRRIDCGTVTKADAQAMLDLLREDERDDAEHDRIAALADCCQPSSTTFKVGVVPFKVEVSG